MLLQVALFHYILWLNNTLSLTDSHTHTHTHMFLIHSSIHGHLGCFHDLAVINSNAVNIGVLVSF